MPADRQHIDVKFFRKNPVLPIGLDGIYMKQDLLIISLDKLSDFRNRLHCSDFIVYIHCGNQNRILIQLRLQIIQADVSMLIDRKIGNPEAHIIQK